MNRFWAMFLSLKQKWSKVYFLIDTNYMEIQTEPFRRYMKEYWAHLADQEDLLICIIEKKDIKRLIWKSLYQLLGIADKIQLFKNHNQAILWLQKQTNYERKLGDKTDNPKRQSPIKLAQQFIKDQLFNLSDQMNIKIDDIAWNQRVNDWKAEIHFLAVYIAGKRFALSFNEIELTRDRGTENWKRMIIDKLNWFLTEDITAQKYNKYRYLDTGKSWIEAKFRKILGSKNIPIQIVEWRNPDKWRYDIPLTRISHTP